LRGEHIQRNYNEIRSTISDGLRVARCQHLGGGTDRTSKGIFRNACPLMTDEDARNKIKGVTPEIVLQVANLSLYEHLLAGCDHLGDTKTLSKQHYYKKSTDFGFAVNLRQTEVKSEYRKKADKLDAEYH
jgi:hypothetical protein